ncbi:helix-turn-helix transcriptional regulator [Modestobacter sp. VKM Ac-2978]|uniref:helix-turn-helix transcriptional regulator n=1 Tax=Modestobacter sp. VKM Ac-2978 TaxID=3004132 RepID=UPI0022AA7049|nr:helix-turn-helix transcriptional regulator [Modestobacter sp. VKM Ac-2978]MCZ2849012.1 helix-turn-helix transcriptional regulator [Modestobacter sp. VKM Ac-2978]
MTQPPSPPRSRPVAAGSSARVAGPRRPQTGGRVAGKAYAPIAPREAGSDESRWPHRDYSDVQPRSLREAYQWWQQICRGVPPRRRSRGWEQQQLAEESGIALNTVQRIERGEWVAAHNLFQVCSVLDLRVEQTVDLDDPAQAFGKGSDPDRDRRLARPAATDRVATREEVLAGRTVIAALARHHNLTEPRVDDEGTVYVRSNASGVAPLWRFASVVAQTVGAWVNVSSDEGEANRHEAQPL